MSSIAVRQAEEATISAPSDSPKPDANDGKGKREPKSRAARLALTGQRGYPGKPTEDSPSTSSNPGHRTSLSGHRSVREAALNRLGGGQKPMSSLAGRLVMMSLAAVVLLGVSLTIITYRPSDAAVDSFRPADRAQYNFKPLNGAKGFAPGRIVGELGEGDGLIELPGEIPLPNSIPAVIGFPGVTGTDPAVEEDETPKPESRRFSERLAEEIAAAKGTMGPELMSQSRQIDAFDREPMFKLDVRVREDVFPPVPPSMSVNEHLYREYHSAERTPIPGGDAKTGPFLFPPMMETPRIAFDGLVRDVAAADPALIAKASLGPRFLHFDRPQAVEAARGYVFTATGRLWMLREQPLRRPVMFGGREVSTAYFGVIAQLRPGLDHERETIHDTVGFTVLSLPPELAKYVIKADATPSNQDLLATETVGVSVTGAWFRRIAFIEQSAAMEVELPQDPDRTKRPENRLKGFMTEDYLPWLVGQTASPAAFTLPPVQGTRALAVMYGESDTPVRASDKDHFDEAGYYALLAHAAGRTPEFLAMPKADITLRDLGTPNFRNQYRGARVGFSGFLLDTYHPLIFPPNVSGLRHGYRAFVADADTKDAVRTELTWYVDVIDPPLEFRGTPRVAVDGHYVRSQIFQAKVRDQTALLTLPIVVARKIEAPGAGQGATADTGITTTHIAIVAGSVLAVIIAVVLLTRRERRREAKWQAEVLANAQARRKGRDAS